MTPAGLSVTCQPGTPIREADLRHWKMLTHFRAALGEQVRREGGLRGTWADPRRELALADYLSLFLFGLYNPVVTTMRGLCEASALPRVQAEVCTRAVSLGSFSEAQALVEPALLRSLFAGFAAQSRPDNARLAGLTGRELVVDSTVWQVLPRMAWAFWRHRSGSQGGPDNAVRLRLDAQWVVDGEETLSAADQAADVLWVGTVRLGKRGDGPRVRVVRLLGQEENVLMATTLDSETTPPELLVQRSRSARAIAAHRSQKTKNSLSAPSRLPTSVLQSEAKSRPCGNLQPLIGPRPATFGPATFDAAQRPPSSVLPN